jgi:hypothetical protein
MALWRLWLVYMTLALALASSHRTVIDVSCLGLAVALSNEAKSFLKEHSSFWDNTKKLRNYMITARTLRGRCEDSARTLKERCEYDKRTIGVQDNFQLIVSMFRLWQSGSDGLKRGNCCCKLWYCFESITYTYVHSSSAVPMLFGRTTLTYTLRESLLVIHSNELTSNRQMGREWILVRP